GRLLAARGSEAWVWELWPALAAGATLHTPAAELLLAPAELWRWLAREEITLCFLPTPLLEAALAQPPESGSRPLRLLLTGGDRLRRQPPAGLPFRLVNHYGPTESTVVTTRYELPAASLSSAPP